MQKSHLGAWRARKAGHQKCPHTLDAPNHKPKRHFRWTNRVPRSYLSKSRNAPCAIRVDTSRAGGSPWAPSAPPWAPSAAPSPCPPVAAAPPITHVPTSATATAAQRAKCRTADPTCLHAIVGSRGGSGAPLRVLAQGAEPQLGWDGSLRRSDGPMTRGWLHIYSAKHITVGGCMSEGR